MNGWRPSVTGHVTSEGYGRETVGAVWVGCFDQGVVWSEPARIIAIDVRRWLTAMRATKLSPSTVAKAYRLLARVLGAAVEGGILGRSPCRVKGAGTEHSY
jgi:hypothetical protein